jgi:hypothetical protein
VNSGRMLSKIPLSNSTKSTQTRSNVKLPVIGDGTVKNYNFNQGEVPFLTL